MLEAAPLLDESIELLRGKYWETSPIKTFSTLDNLYNFKFNDSISDPHILQLHHGTRALFLFIQFD